MIEIEGGCQCGAVRYAGTLDTDEAYFCHCRMCQRATGGVAAALVNARRDAVTWSGRPRDLYRSSPFAHRGHCALCGTPLTFEYDAGSDMLDLTVGSLDEPGLVRLASHFGVESWVPGWIHDDTLPHLRTDEHPPLVERWAAVHKAE
ncbi:GFA family protein [Glacieibacterium frigidum]|uniref:GFA family protein n=1 Tax=Glacieibacterium frigidum TaxID=2593303 RepID=A0A552UJ23_9SPHN|nr:GFA family protein [Glacieibacterium frigidum]TRW18227.1 GFA family protein [Glacieibacterium frigidum]